MRITMLIVRYVFPYFVNNIMYYVYWAIYSTILFWLLLSRTDRSNQEAIISSLAVQYLNTIHVPWCFSQMYEQNGWRYSFHKLPSSARCTPTSFLMRPHWLNNLSADRLCSVNCAFQFMEKLHYYVLNYQDILTEILLLKQLRDNTKAVNLSFLLKLIIR